MTMKGVDETIGEAIAAAAATDGAKRATWLASAQRLKAAQNQLKAAIEAMMAALRDGITCGDKDEEDPFLETVLFNAVSRILDNREVSK